MIREKKVLFIVKSLLKHNRPNAICVENIVNHLRSTSVIVNYLSLETSNCKCKNNSEKDNITSVVIQEKKSSQSFLIFYVKKIFSSLLLDHKIVKKIYASLVRLDSIYSYDVIIAVINPPEIAEAVYYFKKKRKGKKCVLYEIDSNSNRYKHTHTILQVIKKAFSILWEKKIYSSFDKVIHMKTHELHYLSKNFVKFSYKTKFADIPMYIPDHQIQNINNLKMKFVYAGSFYKGLREPQYMIQVMKEVGKVIDFNFEIYTGDRMKRVIFEMIKDNHMFFLKNEVDYSLIVEIEKKADVLISVGNKESDFLSSKILSYMSLGKKIIHFSPNEYDVSIQYFKEYKNILIVNQVMPITIDLVNKVVSFIKKTNLEINWKKLNSSLKQNTPQYSADLLRSIVYEKN